MRTYAAIYCWSSRGSTQGRDIFLFQILPATGDRRSREVLGFGMEGRTWIPIQLPASLSLRHKNHVLQAQGISFVKISGQSCYSVYFVLGLWQKKHLCTVTEYLSQRNLAPGKNLHQQCNNRAISNKSSNKIAEIITVNGKWINIRPVLEKGNKNQPQQGSPTSSPHLNLSNAGISTTSNFVAATWAEAAASERWKFPESQGPLRLRGWAWKDLCAYI